MSFRVSVTKDRQEYDSFVRSQPRTRFLQSWVWGTFQEQLGYKVLRVRILRDDNLAGVAQLILQKLPFGVAYWYCPHGPVVIQDPSLEYGDVLSKLRQWVRENTQAVFLRAEPILPTEHAEHLKKEGWIPTLPVQPQHTWVLDVSGSSEDILQQMHHKTRYNIRLAERKGVSVDVASAAKDLRAFYEFIQAVNARERIRSFSESYYQTMFEVLGEKKNVELLIARFNGNPIVGVLLSHYGDTTTYSHGGSANEHRNLMAPHLLQWRAIERAKERGSRFYDFRGIAGTDAATDPWAGITRFKKGFGGMQESLVGTWDYPFDRMRYSLYTLGRRFFGRTR